MRKALLLASAALVAASAHVARADDAPGAPAVDPFVGREQPLPPALKVMQANGIKITALTPSVGGLNGYLLEDQGGKMQVIYLAPDGKSFVVGVQQVVSQDGRGLQNVTTMQFAALKTRFDDAKRKVDDERRRADEAAASLNDRQRQIGEAEKQFAGAGPQVPAQAPDASVPAPSPTAATPASPAAPPTPEADASEFVSKLDKDRFLADVERTAYFRLGKEKNPTIYMVADPQCPHCHRVWHFLKPLVLSGAVTVKVILIAGLPGSDPLAVSLLSEANPGRAWLEGQGSEDATIPPPPADGSDAARKARGYLNTNMNFITKVNVTGTPWMAYVGKDGKLRQFSGDGDAEIKRFVAGL